MSDKKISQLPASTTPLSGAEELAVVQSGDTKKASVESIFNAVQPSGTANGVVYLNGSKVATSGSTLTYNGTNFGVGTNNPTSSGSNTTTIEAYNAGTGGFLSAKSLNHRVFLGANQVAGLAVLYTATNTTLLLGTNNQERMRILSGGGASFGDTTDPGAGNFRIGNGNLVIGTSGKGIDFSADGSAAGMTSELLDDYEEGTWTPILADSNLVDEGATYTARYGSYTKIGNTVYYVCYLDMSGLGTLSGNAFIIGLPFTSANVSGNLAAGSVGFFTSTGLTVGTVPASRVNSNATWISLSKTTAASTTGMVALTCAEVSASGVLALSGFYQVS